jgi:Ca2+-binding RTX toxin-like protein
LALEEISMTVRKWGAETLVNTNVTGNQNSSAVTALTTGGYVICWTDEDPAGGDGAEASVKFQRYDSAGNKVGAETIANFTAAGDQSDPGVVATDDGGFVIIWRDVDAVEIEYRRFDANGTALDATDRAFALSGIQTAIAGAPLGSGFVIAFEDDNSGTDNIRVQRLLANGNPTGALIEVAASVTNDEVAPAIAELAGGGFVVAWEDDTTERIRIRGFNATGSQTFAAVDVSDIADTSVGTTSITALANGAFVVAWRTDNPIFPEISSPSVRARIVSSTGTLIGTEFTVNTLTDNGQSQPSLAALPNGGFVAVYISDSDLRGQVFDALGARDGDEFVVNSSTNAAQFNPTVAALADGRFVVTWTDNSAVHLDDPDINAVRQQIFDPRDGVVTGTEAGETLFGHDLGNDEINGLGGADTLNGLGGTDSLYGGDGGDTYVVGSGDQVFEFSGGGTDLVQASVSFALGANVENLTLTGAAAINGTGNTLANVITGNAAANVLAGGAGTDSLNGGLGNDTYVLESGNDPVNDTGGTDTITSTITRSLVGFTAIENLTLVNVAAALNGTGNALANIITGNALANVLTGGLAIDTLIGGLGNDTYVLENGADKVTDSGGTADLATSTISRSLAAAGLTTIEKLTLLGVAAANGTGNNLANIISGNASANRLDGGIGNDTLDGLAGNDTLIGNAGRDIASGGAGNDIFRFLNKTHSFGALTDIVTDFDDSGNDRIDVSALFGPALIYRHNLAFTAAGQLRINDVAGADVIVEVNTGGSLAADFQIRLAGTTLASMTAGDFFL